jgi:hypothetical protein
MLMPMLSAFCTIISCTHTATFRWYVVLSGSALQSHDGTANPKLTCALAAAVGQRYTAFGSYWLTVHIIAVLKGAELQKEGRLAAEPVVQRLGFVLIPNTMLSLPV